MPEYLSPGVYIEEIEIGGKPIEGVSTSTAGFLGRTERGPVTPRLVTGFEDFRRVFGYYTDDSSLPFAIDGFFRNGGQRCFVGRIVRIKDQDSTKNAKIVTATSSSLDIKAIGPGSWGTRIAFKIEPAGLKKTELFKLTVMYWQTENLPSITSGKPKIDPTSNLPDDRKSPDRREPDVIEPFDNLSMISTSPDYFKKRVNGISNLIKVDSVVGKETTRPTDAVLAMLADPANNPSQFDGASEVSSADYDGKEERITVDKETVFERSGLIGFKFVDEINIVCAPDDHLYGDLYDKLVDHCEDPELKDRFAILQSKQDDIPSNIGTSLRPPRDSKYAAFYYPWIKIVDPRSNKDKLIPPGGHIAGIYARSDTERGVHKAPANEIVKGARAVQFTINKRQQDILNPIGVNVIRAFPGRGIRVWGARTTSTDPLWKYINVRRLFLFLEESIDESTQWVVFEPNNEQLWARIKQTITAFLTTVWRTGALMGTTAEEAFFVKVDRTTMTQNDIDTGKLIVIIGIAPTKPAEFVIFRFTQFTAGADAA
jgi:phage tail sheath protein FI